MIWQLLRASERERERAMGRGRDGEMGEGEKGMEGYVSLFVHWKFVAQELSSLPHCDGKTRLYVNTTPVLAYLSFSLDLNHGIQLCLYCFNDFNNYICEYRIY